MAIENFTKSDFEAALPKGAWRDNGIDPKTGQYTYVVTPQNAGLFAILVWSSLQPDGSSSKEAGHDSIRAVITHEGKPWGGKIKRWVPRTSGWRKNLADMLLAAKAQIMFLQQPCESCGGPCKPFTVQKAGPNKGRQFVSCKNEGCAKPAWRWCDQEQPAAAAPANAVPSEAPTCPKCQHHPMVRMSSGKGWRCGSPGNRWLDGAWTVCDGAIFDNAKAPPVETPPAVKPQAPVKTPPVKSALPADAVATVKAALAHLDNATDMDYCDAIDAARALLKTLV